MAKPTTKRKNRIDKMRVDEIINALTKVSYYNNARRLYKSNQSKTKTWQM